MGNFDGLLTYSTYTTNDATSAQPLSIDEIVKMVDEVGLVPRRVLIVGKGASAGSTEQQVLNALATIPIPIIESPHLPDDSFLLFNSRLMEELSSVFQIPDEALRLTPSSFAELQMLRMDIDFPSIVPPSYWRCFDEVSPWPPPQWERERKARKIRRRLRHKICRLHSADLRGDLGAAGKKAMRRACKQLMGMIMAVGDE